MSYNLPSCHFFPTNSIDIFVSSYINIGIPVIPVTMSSLAIEFCAFTVAIAVECHPTSDTDVRTQWSPTKLSLEIRACPWGEDVSFIVIPEALHQALFLFKKVLARQLYHELILMGGKKGVNQILSFMELPERYAGLNIIFVWSQPSIVTYEEKVVKIRSTADILLSGMWSNISKFK